MPSTFFKAEHVGFNHHIALPCERVAVLRGQLEALSWLQGNKSRVEPE